MENLNLSHQIAFCALYLPEKFGDIAISETHHFLGWNILLGSLSTKDLDGSPLLNSHGHIKYNISAE